MKKYNKKKIITTILLVFIPLVIISTFSIVKSYLGKKKEEALIKKNYTLLQKLENRNIDAIEKKYQIE